MCTNNYLYSYKSEYMEYIFFYFYPWLVMNWEHREIQLNKKRTKKKIKITLEIYGSWLKRCKDFNQFDAFVERKIIFICILLWLSLFFNLFYNCIQVIKILCTWKLIKIPNYITSVCVPMIVMAYILCHITTE